MSFALKDLPSLGAASSFKDFLNVIEEIEEIEEIEKIEKIEKIKKIEKIEECSNFFCYDADASWPAICKQLLCEERGSAFQYNSIQSKAHEI